jgi:hypothetical protein
MFSSILLFGCFGGGAEPDPTPTPTPSPSTTITLGVDCSGNYCNSNGNSYVEGYGTGIWRAKNDVADSATLNVELSNVANKEITIVFTNEGDTDVTLPKINVNTFLYSTASNANTPLYSTASNDFIEASKKVIHFEKGFSNEELIKIYQRSLLSNEQPLKSIVAQAWSTDDTKEWLVLKPDNTIEKRKATLKKQSASSNGRTINFWVEDDEYQLDKITSGILNSIADKFLAVYPKIVDLAGEPWGPHGYINEAIPANQQLNIVFANFDKNKTPYGVVGYFYSINNAIGQEYSNQSNQALVLFVDTETIYLGGSTGLSISLSTTVHELTHAINFYQRKVIALDPFDTFLNELSAVLTEDLFSSQLHDSFNNNLIRYQNWLSSSANYNKDFAKWASEDGTTNYNIAGSFGAYLLRQYGINFYKTLFKTSGNLSAADVKASSLYILDKAIKTYDGKGLGGALQRWGAGISLFRYETPNSYGYPEYSDSGFYLQPFYGDEFSNIRKLPTSSPSVLSAHAHFPFLRKISQSTFKESFTVPRNVSVTVIVK